MDLCLLNITLMASMLDLCYLWYSCDVAWDICVIIWYLWWMCLIYTILLVWNVYMLSLWWWMWLLHKNRKNTKKTASFAECFYPNTRQSNYFFYLLEKRFAECIYLGTRRSLNLCQVPRVWHSPKLRTSPSVYVIALGKSFFQKIEKWLLCRVSR